MFGADGSPISRVRRALGRDAQSRCDEQVATDVLDLLRTPLTGQGSPANIQQVRAAARTIEPGFGAFAATERVASDRRTEGGRNGRRQCGRFSPNEFFGY